MKVTGQKTPRTMSASTLIGDDVKNKAGEDLGDVKEIMLDMETGQVSYVVVSFGGFLGMGDKLFAVPWNAFTLNTDDHSFILDVPKDRLEKAPGFDKDRWPDFADRTWGATIHQYYKQRPYWESYKETGA